jgi:hypothetical protein
LLSQAESAILEKDHSPPGLFVYFMSELHNVGVGQVSSGMTSRNKYGVRSIMKEEYETLASFRSHLPQFLRVSETATRFVGLATIAYLEIPTRPENASAVT